MPITLRIIDRDQLPDGGPISFTAGPRGFDIGREQHLDWCLPDPERYVSGHHCQVRFENGDYWLNDISTNGTFVNGASVRVKSPYRLADGDQLQIGTYQIAVSIEGGAAAASPLGASTPEAPPTPAANPFDSPFAAPAAAPPQVHDIWASPLPAAAPVARRDFVNQQRADQGIRPPDVLEQFIELPVARPVPLAPDELKPIAAVGLSQLPGSKISEHTSEATPAQPPGRPHPSESDLLRVIAQSAGLPPEALAGRDPRQVAEQIGEVLRITAEEMIGLLQGRASAKRITKSANRTMIGSTDNNPMKFTANPAEALEIMLARNRPGYLDAPKSLREAFADVQSHEKATFAAMQKALLRLTEDLTPDSVEEKAKTGPFGSSKAKAWELYVQRWNAKTEHYENGILDVFFAYFSEIYDTMTKK